MKIVKKILYIILALILAIILGYNVYSFVCTNILGRDLATVKGYGVLEVVSGSMEPTIHVGDLIIINTRDNDYNENDIITFYDREGSFVTHRIISIDGDEMITQGDNNNSEDDSIDKSSIVGKYVTKVNGGGKIINSLKSPFTLIMILVIGVLVCVFISVDENGNPILSEDEKDYQEFIEYQNQKLKKNKKEKTAKKTLASKEKKKETAKKPQTKTNKTTFKKTTKSGNTSKNSAKKTESKKVEKTNSTKVAQATKKTMNKKGTASKKNTSKKEK